MSHEKTVLIAGGGIAGLSLALTCHQMGVPFRVFEAVPQIKPLGVGINLQPSAVRELFDLGLESALEGIGVRTRDYGMYTQFGLHIWTEPRGLWAGYRWPQYSVHRGQLHMLLLQTLVERAGPDCIECGWRTVGFANEPGAAVLQLINPSGERRQERGAVLIGADGIHSAIRKQMAPHEGEPRWNGAMLWRGTTRARPFKTGASMVMVGHSGLRFVSYPISAPDPQTGLATLNWIANLQFDPEGAFNKEDWNREARLSDFLPQFESMRFDWLDVPSLVRAADRVFEYPMVDRDPLECWTHGRVSLMGDAAHAAYPVGSNGAGSAIIDARKIGRAFIDHGLTPDALQTYESEMRPITTKVILTNRVAGPDQILDVVQERCGGRFDRIEDVISGEELAAHAQRYKAIAGYAIAATNDAPATIPEARRRAMPAQGPSGQVSRRQWGQVCLLAAGVSLLGFSGRSAGSSGRFVDLQGHRGARWHRAENTIEGFELALQMGARTLELDVVATRDDVLVISHDPALNPDITRDAQGRFLDSPGPNIISLDWPLLAAYDVGRIKPGSRYARTFAEQQGQDGLRIPRLRDLFARVAQLGRSDVRFAIETKITPHSSHQTPSPERFVSLLMQEVNAAGVQERVQVLSFDWRTLAVLRDQHPKIDRVHITAQLPSIDNLQIRSGQDSAWTAGIQYRQHRSVPRMVAAAGGTHWSSFWRELDAAVIREAQDLGLKVLAWTVNEREVMNRLLDWGIDGLVTDRPDLGAEVLRARGLRIA